MEIITLVPSLDTRKISLSTRNLRVHRFPWQSYSIIVFTQQPQQRSHANAS